MKKGNVLILAIAATALLGGSAWLYAKKTGGHEEKKTSLRIGVLLYRGDDTFIGTLRNSMEQAAKEYEKETGVRVTLDVRDAKRNQLTQNSQAERMIDLGCDVLCVNMVDRTAAAVIIDKAQAVNVPVIFFNREPVLEDLRRWERAYYVGLPAEDAGRLQGGIVLEAWQEGRLDRSGDGVLQYVMLEGETGHQDALLRTEYSVRTLTDAGVPTEKLANDTADWQRGQASIRMDQWLREFGGSAIEAVFANNDDMALGAIDACLEFGMSPEELPFIVGVDATPPALEALENGTLAGTVQNDALGQASGIFSLISALTQGRDPAQTLELTDGTYVWLDYTTVTRENLKDFLGDTNNT